MGRYRITFLGGSGGEARRYFLVPFDPSRAVGELQTEVRRRLRRLGEEIADDGLQLRLDSAAGPVLDCEDSLDSVILDAEKEVIFVADSTAAALQTDAPAQSSADANRTDTGATLPSTAQSEPPINVRVVTPALARRARVPAEIALMPQVFSPRTTLRQLRASVYQHLSLPNADENDPVDGNECNCSLARAIINGQLLKVATSTGGGRILVIHSRSVVDVIDSDTLRESAALEQARAKLGNLEGLDLQSKRLQYHGGASALSSSNNPLAVVTVCSKNRHPDSNSSTAVAASDEGHLTTMLDIHTAECLIKTPYLDLTIEQVGLSDVAIDGIVILFVVARQTSNHDRTNRGTGTGKEGVYLQQPCWTVPVKQSERGMAMFLSTVRVFEHLVTEEADQALHDSLLHVLHLLTNFPPAIRALHILLEGNAPKAEECAALIQATCEIMKDVVAETPFAQDPSRFLEASRIFFGMILAKANRHALKNIEGSTPPYVGSMKALTLVNTETMENIASPVNTTAGLMEQGLYNALKSGCLAFSDTTLQDSLEETALGGQLMRAARLSGGLVSTSTIFDMDTLFSHYRYSDGGSRDSIMTPEETTDIVQHAVAATTSKLTIVRPARLESASSPSLTLDRDGFAAVYVGRQGCGGEPGKDFLIFRPTQGGECAIDVSVVTQLLEPILATRAQDGSAIFDGLDGTIMPKAESPDEVLMICVDSSASMGKPAGFVDMDTSDDNEPTEKSEEEILLAEIMENETFTGSVETAKEFLQGHESFQDIVMTVKSCRVGGHQKRMAERLLRGVIAAKVDELQDRMSSQDVFQFTRWGGSSRSRGREEAANEKIKKLRLDIAMLSHRQSSLVDFLIFRAIGMRESESAASEPWTWTPGNPVPTAPTTVFASTQLDLCVPAELCCSMTQDLLEEPVKTEDGHVYEQSAIRRWFRSTTTSPNTGLPLKSTTLVPDRVMAVKLRNWVEGLDFVEEGTPRTRRGSVYHRNSSTVRLTFTSRSGLFSRHVPSDTTATRLYELAFRRLKGHYSAFDLLHQGNIIPTAATSIHTFDIKDGSHINISIAPSNGMSIVRPSGAAGDSPSSGFCLVKLYLSADEPTVSYWARSDSSDTMSSVTFKLWRYLVKTGRESSMTSSAVWWHSLKDRGDDFMSGHTSKSWDKLSKYFDRVYATGVLGNEPLCIKQAKTRGAADGVEVESSATGNDRTMETGPQPRVLKLYLRRSGKKRKRSSAPPSLSRLGLLKQMFDQFVNRIVAYNFTTHLGLITFGSTAKVSQRITHVVENFRSTVQSLTDNGDTALWDALALARDQVQEYAATHPNAKKRILCISDGVDTSSTHKGQGIFEMLRRDGIVLDSFCLGRDDNCELRAVSFLTNGYKFHPTSLQQAMAICEMEPVLSQLERENPPRASTSSTINFTWTQFEQAKTLARPETVTQDVFPKRKEHPRLTDSFVELKAVSRSRLNSHRGDTTSTAMRTYRILTEMQLIAAKPHPHYDVYVSESNMAFWKVVMQGPPGSIYQDGTFVVYLDMEEGRYPSFAPQARFVTRIHHPNVNRHGRICHSIFDRNWTADTSTSMVLSTIYGLLLAPDYSDPVNIVVTLDFHHDQVAFADAAREQIRKHALKTRAQWRNEILRSAP